MLHTFLRPKFKDARSETIWLTIYADLITNLVLLFLALYGLTLMGDDALAKAIQSMKMEDIYKLQLDPTKKFEDIAPVLRKKITQNTNLNISDDVGTVRIEFGEKILFESGSAVPKESAEKILGLVADLLKTVPHTIVVEGHTDSAPLQRGGKYRDNWELSLARAMSIVHLLVKLGVAPDHLAAAAYGFYRPRSSNLTATGRSLNRRVEISLFKNFAYEPKL
jgi:chemotaxis protein MotB